jgi:hypothetical protein
MANRHSFDPVLERAHRFLAAGAQGDFNQAGHSAFLVSLAAR